MSNTMRMLVDASFVNDAIRSAYSRGDWGLVKKMVSNIPDEMILDICEERADITGDSRRGFGVDYRARED